MEKKKRYCPSCGAKTNDGICEICGRHTKAISERYHEQNLYILEDDVASDEDRQYVDEQKEKARKTNANAKAFAQEAKHPQYEYKAFQHPNFEKPKFEHPKMSFEKTNKRSKHIYKEQENPASLDFLKNFIGVFIFIILLIIFLIVITVDAREEEQEVEPMDDYEIQTAYVTYTYENINKFVD